MLTLRLQVIGTAFGERSTVLIGTVRRRRESSGPSTEGAVALTKRASRTNPCVSTTTQISTPPKSERFCLRNALRSQPVTAMTSPPTRSARFRSRRHTASFQIKLLQPPVRAGISPKLPFDQAVDSRLAGRTRGDADSLRDPTARN